MLVYNMTNSNWASLGNYLIAIYGLAVAYIILRYRFLDIEVLIKKTLVFAGLFSSIFVIVSLLILIAQHLLQYLLNKVVHFNIWVSLGVSIIFMIVLYDRLKAFLINVTNKYLFQKKYDPVDLIITFSKSVLTELNLDKIAKSMIDKLVSALNLMNCALLIPNTEGNKFIIKESFGIQDKKIAYENNSPMVSYLERVNSVILRNGEKSLSELIIKDMKLIDANVCLGIMIHKQLIGVLSLGRKKSDEDYTKKDIDTLVLLADALGIAITNALTFESARQKEKLAAIGMLAAGIKHDIGTPLNQMSTAVQLFLIEKEEGDHKKLPIEQILSSAYDLLMRCQMTFVKIARISAKFADFARPKRAADLELINIAESINDAISVLETEIQAKGASIRKDIEDDLPPIRADKEYMQEIFFNIIKNAGQAIEEANRNKDEALISITAKQTSDKDVLVEIKDTGVGIPADGLDKIFEAYYTTKQGRGGTGLGLAIVKELVERNNGKISVKSELGKGTSFILEFQGARDGR
jgi:signal transduction histidine kinase